MNTCNLSISKEFFWIVFIPHWPDAANGARLRGLIELLQFYPLDVLHVIMNHLQMSEQNTGGNQWSGAVNKYNWKGSFFFSPQSFLTSVCRWWRELYSFFSSTSRSSNLPTETTYGVQGQNSFSGQ